MWIIIAEKGCFHITAQLALSLINVILTFIVQITMSSQVLYYCIFFFLELGI